MDSDRKLAPIFRRLVSFRHFVSTLWGVHGAQGRAAQARLWRCPTTWWRRNFKSFGGVRNDVFGYAWDLDTLCLVVVTGRYDL
jgi:hypothetical protein